MESLPTYDRLMALLSPPSRDVHLVAKDARWLKDYIQALESRWMHYGIWNEAWESCCRVHCIDMTERERERISIAVKDSYYATQSVDQSENTETDEAATS